MNHFVNNVLRSAAFAYQKQELEKQLDRQVSDQELLCRIWLLHVEKEADRSRQEAAGQHLLMLWVPTLRKRIIELMCAARQITLLEVYDTVTSPEIVAVILQLDLEPFVEQAKRELNLPEGKLVQFPGGNSEAQ